jgi:threonine dehydratase
MAGSSQAAIGIGEIRAAAARLDGLLHRTPLLSASALGARAKVRLLLKCESFQKTGSFKPRGALNIVLSLSSAERERGLITVSAGNHAQAVAWAAAHVRTPCTVVMPSGAPRSKIDAVRGYGAEVVLHDDRNTVFDRLETERARTGATFIHPFDDPVGLAGAGTVALEILAEAPQVEAVVVPVGGGGLMAGVASAIKAMNPRCRVIAVELDAGPGMGPAIAAGKPVPVSRPADTLADGMTPPFVGAIPLAVARECVDEIVTVTEEEIREAMRSLATRAKLYVEGSGAAATAAVIAGRVRMREGALVVALVSGGNVDPERWITLFPSSAAESGRGA